MLRKVFSVIFIGSINLRIKMGKKAQDITNFIEILISSTEKYDAKLKLRIWQVGGGRGSFSPSL
jgi:hypothetical protein